jgi:hypothetical protein
MSLDVYSHAIAVQEIDVKALRELLEAAAPASAVPAGDAPVMHEAHLAE